MSHSVRLVLMFATGSLGDGTKVIVLRSPLYCWIRRRAIVLFIGSRESHLGETSETVSSVRCDIAGY